MLIKYTTIYEYIYIQILTDYQKERSYVILGEMQESLIILNTNVKRIYYVINTIHIYIINMYNLYLSDENDFNSINQS